MKKYLFLRNNQETGPYSIEQLASIGLFPLDLIWIENESTNWKYPDEIDELRSLIKTENAIPFQKKNPSVENKKIFISLPSNFIQKRHEMNEEYASIPVNEKNEVLETNYVQSVEDLKKNYEASKQKKSIWNKRLITSSHSVTIVVVFIGVMLGAFVIKKWVDGSVDDNTEVAVATPIVDRDPTSQPNENIQNALVTEIVPVYKNATPKTSRHSDVKKQLKLEASDYKVGLFGGINGLQLTVFNASSQVVDKAIVSVDYLKRNGNVVQSQNVSFSSIKPKGMQTIAVPGSSRGVKVRYKVVKVHSHDYKNDLKKEV